MRLNTTDHLISDIERLRDHFGVDRWLLFGGSWGSTLILAYAERYPERVSEIVICSVTMTRRSEIDWLYRGVSRFFPEEWEKFRAGVPEGDRDRNIVGAYASLMEHPDADVRTRAAIEWATWEDTVLSLEPNGKLNPYGDRPLADLLAFVRITTHYFSEWRMAPRGRTPHRCTATRRHSGRVDPWSARSELCCYHGMGTRPRLAGRASDCRCGFGPQRQRFDEGAHIRGAREVRRPLTHYPR
jgi:pimeloyl-ACP methyl ester carboxylesterase